MQEYVARIRQHIGDYADCYEKNYAQKWEMGLFRLYAKDSELTSSIAISRDPESVDGLVVVGGYSQVGAVAIRKLKANHPDIKVLPMTRRLDTGTPSERASNNRIPGTPHLIQSIVQSGPLDS